MKKQYSTPDLDMFRYAAEDAMANGSGGYESPTFPDEGSDNIGNDPF